MSSDFERMLDAFRVHPEIAVLPPRGLPPEKLLGLLPLDLRRFYEVCGGVEFFLEADYPARVVGPDELVSTSSIFWSLESEETLREMAGDRSWHWYAVVSDEKGDYISMDLARERLGRCYDSSRDRYAVPGESPIVVTSFTDLLERLAANRGEYWYWLRDDFERLGDAYD